MVSLAGTRWNGQGLDVETSNGGVMLAIPEGYNADLTTRTGTARKGSGTKGHRRVPDQR